MPNEQLRCLQYVPVLYEHTVYCLCVVLGSMLHVGQHVVTRFPASTFISNYRDLVIGFRRQIVT